MLLSTIQRLIICAFLFTLPSLSYSQTTTPPDNPDTLRRMADEEERRLIDPLLKRVPYERLDEARQQLNRKAAGARTAIPNITWQERGPNNLGGRTRALLFDPNDATHKKVWAGSIAGGLWYTNDITDANAGWTPVSDSWENMMVTALAADPSNPQVMYAGTGDYYDSQAGGGIWKTTNGGSTWTRLSSTIPGGSYPSINQSFLYIQRIVVTNTGKVFAATRFGIIKSTDGGSTWSFALAPGQLIGIGGIAADYYNDNVTDLEIGADGILYAGFTPSRVFKSNDATGTTWTEITPQGATGGQRTELALSLSTSGASQVIYGVSRASNSVNYRQDLRWFKKSVNGGATWTDMAVPMYSSDSFFTNGNGYSNLALSAHPTDPNTLYAGGNNWYRSTDGGATWSSALLNVSSPYQNLILFQPGGTGAVLCGHQGVTWSADWGQPTPAIINRNTGYRTSSFYSVSMKATPGNAYLVGSAKTYGITKLPDANLSAGTVVHNFDGLGYTFIDEEDPSIQPFYASGSLYFYNGTYPNYLTYTHYIVGATEYDSQSNTLYAADLDYSAGNYTNTILKVTGVGGTAASSYLPISGVSGIPSFFKLNSNKQTMFIGTQNGTLYKVTNLNQATPTVVSIINSSFQQTGYVSCIDVGSTDNELLVTLSNFGTKSVWYTNNGGATWTSKDESGYGLPDVPVRSALFNPQNRKQVLLGTDAGVWSTDDITATNPGWGFSSSGMGAFPINQLSYRASDGRIAAATFGRGVFTTDAFAIAYTLPSISISSISNTTLCAGNTLTVSFSTTGPAFGTGNKFEVWLSDATGNFANPLKIGSSTTSPISATLPGGYSALPYGTNYQIKVIATNPEVESSPSNALAIGNLGGASIYDRRMEFSQNYSNGTICPGSQSTLKVYPYNLNYSATTAETYQWLRNGSPISGATSATISAQQSGTYTAVTKQAGCLITSYTYELSTSNSPYAYIASPSNGEPQCDDHPLKLFSSYIGETAGFQWSLDGVDITGATSYTYVANQTGNYTFRMTDGSCSYTTSSSYFQFGRSLLARVFLSSSGDSLICASSPYYNVSMYASLPSSNDYTVQWYRNGFAVSGATSAYYSTSQPGEYSILLKQGTCQTYSNAVSIRLADQLQSSINYSFASKSVCPGESRYLYAGVSYNGSLQWQKDGVDIAGATGSGYTATTSGDYTLKLTRGSCSAISPPVSLTFSNALQPKVISYTLESCYGRSIYSYDGFYLSGYQYQWYRNGVLVSNAIYDSYYATQSGAYAVRVTNGSCTGLSKEVYVNVGNGQTAKPVITYSPAALQLCPGNSLALTANSYTGTLQWKRNGIAIAGATSSPYFATQSGLYTVVSTDGSCTAESDPIDVKIGETTTASLSGSALIGSGQSAQLPVSFTGPAPWSFTLSNGQSVTATYQNPTLISVSPTSTTTYQLASVGNACGLGTVSGQASVSVGSGSADVSLNMAVSTRTPNVGDLITYTMTANNTGPDNAQGVQLSSILPSGLSFASTSSPGVSYANGIVSANLGSIPANNQSVVSFQATPTQPGVFVTSAQISGNQTPDPDSQPNSGTGDGQDDAVTVDIRTPVGGGVIASANPNQIPLPMVQSNQPATDPNTADLSLRMWVDNETPTVSDIVTTSLTVSNRGGSTAASIIVQVTLPNGTFSAQSPIGWIQVNSQTYKIYINSLAAGKSSTVFLKWQPAASGSIQAQILDTDTTDPDSTPGNGYTNGEDDTATVSVRVR